MSAWEKFRGNLLRLLSGGCLAFLAVGGAMAQDRGQATVFLYHRFGEARYPSTSISIPQFEAHIAELTSGRYHVMPLETIVDTLAAGKPLPEYAVAITIDDGFVSTYHEAWPRLRAAGLPFTIFITSDVVDKKASGNLSWDQIREMLAGGGVTVGNHTAAHHHMPRVTEAENSADIVKANTRFQEELGLRPALFAYPYGQYSKRDVGQISALAFKAAFGQYSGVVHSGANRFALPRFEMNVHYGDIGRFVLAANALPLPVLNITPENPLLGADNNPPAFGFTAHASVTGLDQLHCYASNQVDAVPVQHLEDNRIEVRLQAPFKPGLGRINCTLPTSSGRWRWLGQAFLIP